MVTPVDHLPDHLGEPVLVSAFLVDPVREVGPFLLHGDSDADVLEQLLLLGSFRHLEDDRCRRWPPRRECRRFTIGDMAAVERSGRARMYVCREVGWAEVDLTALSQSDRVDAERPSREETE